MAASRDLRGRVMEIATCPVCLEDFKEPKSLPCLHTFCLRCLEQHCKDKLPGGEIPCPLCRKEFAIPSKGLSELPHNFLIQCLIDAKEATSENANDVICEVCSSDDGDGVKATVYCVDCSQILCERCSLPHKKMRGGPHEIQQIVAELRQRPELTQSHVGYCDKHKDETTELYCLDCQRNLCFICFATEHQQHSCQEIESVAEELSKHINDVMLALSRQMHHMREKAKQLDAERSKFLDGVTTVELTIQRTGDTVKQLVDQQVNKLFQELQEMKSVRMKEIDTRSESISLVLLAMESFHNYCEELKTNEAASGITRAVNGLNTRCSELQTYVVPVDLCVDPISFVPTSLDEFTENGQSLVGLLLTKSIRAFGPPSIPEPTEWDAGVLENEQTPEDLPPPPPPPSIIGMFATLSAIEKARKAVPRPYHYTWPQLVKKLNTPSIAYGVTQMDDKIFVVCLPDTIKVFRQNYEHLEYIKVNVFKRPQDIVACSDTRSLYVADIESPGCV